MTLQSLIAAARVRSNQQNIAATNNTCALDRIEVREFFGIFPKAFLDQLVHDAKKNNK